MAPVGRQIFLADGAVLEVYPASHPLHACQKAVVTAVVQLDPLEHSRNPESCRGKNDQLVIRPDLRVLPGLFAPFRLAWLTFVQPRNLKTFGREKLSYI